MDTVKDLLKVINKDAYYETYIESVINIAVYNKSTDILEELLNLPNIQISVDTISRAVALGDLSTLRLF